MSATVLKLHERIRYYREDVLCRHRKNVGLKIHVVAANCNWWRNEKVAAKEGRLSYISLKSISRDMLLSCQPSGSISAHNTRKVSRLTNVTRS